MRSPLACGVCGTSTVKDRKTHKHSPVHRWPHAQARAALSPTHSLRRQNARLGRHHNPTHVALETLKAAMLLPHSTCVQGSALALAPWAHTGLHCGTRKRPGLQVCSASGPSGDSRPGSRPLSHPSLHMTRITLAVPAVLARGGLRARSAVLGRLASQTVWRSGEAIEEVISWVKFA